MEGTTKTKLYIIPVFAIALLTAIDQLSKFIISSGYEIGQSKTVIDGVFNITYVQNEGMAWGAFKGGRIIFIIVTVLVLIFAFYVYTRIAEEKGFLFFRILLIFFISGSVGNLIDRASKGYVVDFFHFCLINFPVFNVADVYLTVSLILMAVTVIFFFDDEKFDKAFSFKKKQETKDE